MTDKQELADDEVRFHKNRLSSGITEVTAWSLIPIKESKAFEINKSLGTESLPLNFKITQKPDGAYVSTWVYNDYERMETDG